jgi:hypothetical protein
MKYIHRKLEKKQRDLSSSFPVVMVTGGIHAAGSINVGTGSVICNSRNIYPIDDNVWAVPQWLV